MKTASVAIQRHSFNGGELAPDLVYREDLEQYHNRCRTLENCLVSLTGAAFRRPGTQFRAVVSGESGDTFRLFPFTFDRDTTFQVLFACNSEFDCRIYDSTGAVVVENLEVPYLPEELPQLRACQSYDVLFLAHPAHPVKRLERRPTGWALVDHVFRGGPYRDLETEAKGTVRFYVEEFHPLATYEVGEYVTSGTSSSGNTGMDVAENVALSLSTLFQREDVWTNPQETIKRTYPTIKITTDDNNVGSIAPPGSVVRVVGCSDTDLDGYYVVAGAENHNSTLFLHQDDYYLEMDSEAATGMGVVDTRGDFPALAYLEQDSIAVLSRLERDALIWKKKAIGGVGTGPLDVDGPDYWTEVYQWEGPVFSVAWDPDRFGDTGLPFDPSTETTHVFTSDMEDIGWRARTTAKAEIAGRFKRTSATSVVYRDGTGPTDKVTYNPAITDVVSRTFPLFGNAMLRTEGGTWKGTLSLQTSEDDGITWHDAATVSSLNNRNGTASTIVRRTGTLGRVIYEDIDDTGLSDADYDENNTCHWFVTVSGERFDEFTFVAEHCEPGLLGELQPLFPLRERGTTPFWSWSAFNPVFGYPRAITIHEERLTLASTNAQPGTVFSSAINDWEEWGAGSLDTSPLIFTPASDTWSGIEWILSKQDLLIGSSTGLWSIGSRSSETALGPLAVSAKRHSTLGSAPIQAIATAETVAFVERGAMRLQGTTFDFATDAMLTEDLSALSTHIRDFCEMAWQTVPYSLLWFLRADGTLASFAANRQHAVAGWSRHTIGNEVLSICVTPTDQGADVLWLVVRRGSSFYLESLSLDSTTYLDCFVTATGSPRVATLSLPTGLSGYTVSAQGVALSTPDHYSVSSNTVTIDSEHDFTRVDVGVAFVSTLRPTALSTHGGKYRVSGVDLYLSDSFGLEISLDGAATWQGVHLTNSSAFGHIGNGVAVPPQPVSGRKFSEARSGYVDEVDVALRSSFNGGFKVLALAARATATEVR